MAPDSRSITKVCMAHNGAGVAQILGRQDDLSPCGHDIFDHEDPQAADVTPFTHSLGAIRLEASFPDEKGREPGLC